MTNKQVEEFLKEIGGLKSAYYPDKIIKKQNI